MLILVDWLKQIEIEIEKQKTWREIPVHTVVKNKISVVECAEWINIPVGIFYEALLCYTYHRIASFILFFSFMLFLIQSWFWNLDAVSNIYIFVIRDAKHTKELKKSDLLTTVFYNSTLKFKTMYFLHLDGWKIGAFSGWFFFLFSQVSTVKKDFFVFLLILYDNFVW